MARIAVDVDDSLYSFADIARRTMSELAVKEDNPRLRNAAYATWDEWRSPADLAGEDAWERIVDICHSPENILAQTPFPGAVEVLHELAQDHELVYASNRSESTHAPTSAWLDQHGFPEGQLLCHRDDKLASIRNCQYLIDDRPKTLVGFVHGAWEPFPGGVTVFRSELHPRKAFGLVTAYNRSLTDVPGIYLAPSWPLLRSFLRTKIA